MTSSRFLRPFTLLVALAAAAHTLRAQTEAPAAGPGSWLTSDPKARTVTLDLQVTAPPGSPSAVLNGYREGGVQIVVPLRWTITWNWRSSDSTAPHSLVLMAEREKIPTEGGRPAFINAMTRMVTEGLPPGQPDRTTFEAEQPGWYWLLCGVPSHALKGEWVGLKVDAEATTGRVEEKGR